MAFYARFCRFSKKEAHGAVFRGIFRNGTSYTTVARYGGGRDAKGERSAFERILKEPAASRRVNARAGGGKNNGDRGFKEREKRRYGWGKRL
jgi:hypothetical protein